MAEEKKKKKWIKAMHMKKGAMTEAAEREGLSNSEYEQKHKHDSGKAGKRARLALTFSHMRKGMYGSKEK